MAPQTQQRERRDWVVADDGEKWCRDNGGPADCEYHATRPAALGSHQAYRHDVTRPASAALYGRRQARPASPESADNYDVVSLMQRMGDELRRLWAMEDEAKQMRAALSAITAAARQLDAENAELRVRTMRPTIAYSTSTGDPGRRPGNPVLSSSEVQRLMAAPNGGR